MDPKIDANSDSQTDPQPDQNTPTAAAGTWKRRFRNMGILAFLFFFIKGLVWLAIGGLAVWGFWG